MELKFTVFDCMCSMKLFEINNIRADEDDFGEKYDRDSENAEDYACGDMRFTGKPATSEVLTRYQITVDEYAEVVKKLEDGLSFGCCGWCV